MILAIVLLAVLAQASAAPLSFASVPWTRPTPTPVLWDGAPAVRYSVTLEPLDLSADGTARVLVRVRFQALDGTETHLLRGGDFDYFPSRGVAQWQTRLRYGGPASIVRVTASGPLEVRVVANKPTGLGTIRAHLTAAQLVVPPLIARAIGPHLVQLGFFPRVTAGNVRIERADSSGAYRTIARLAATLSTYRDSAVVPNGNPRYRVTIAGRATRVLDVHVPAEFAPGSLATVRGTGAWLAFSGSTRDDDSYTRLDPERTIATAARIGLHYLMVRLTYGEFWQITPEAKATIDRLIDRAAERHIAVLAWTVPREPSAEDIAANVAALAYRTPAGNGLRGLAVDLERGEEFLGRGRSGYAALASYLGFVRSAVGARALIVATVEDPYLEKLDNHAFPYRTIAKSADVLQPMTYWRMLRRSTTAAGMRDAIAGSVRALRSQAGPLRPISVGGQTVPLSPSGGPPPAELAQSIEACKRAGAIGEAFYAWTGTTGEQFDAIGRARW